MTISDLLHQRLLNQQIATPKFTQPGEVISWMVAMQAQEFAMAKWAIGLRSSGVNDADVENAFNNGAILRTHLMRPTWHFVAPSDIRWMLALTAGRVNTANAFMYRKLELDNGIFRRSNRVLTMALQGGNQLTRTTLKAALGHKRIFADGLRLGYLFMRAELDGIICSGPRLGKQFAYALLEERVAKSKPLSREESLATFCNRYFASRGPATVHDFAYWSGLTVKEAKEGAAYLHPEFVHESFDGDDYISRPGVFPVRGNHVKTFLMPDYDEYGMSYKNRSALSISTMPGKKDEDAIISVRQASDYSHWLVIDGRIAGTWERTVKGKETTANATPFISLSKGRRDTVSNAEKRFALFANKRG